MAAVPPTTHSLPKPQRLRLMRSTRKLTALLGTTPLLVDARDDTEPLRTSQSPLEPIENDACPATIASILSSAECAPDETENPAALVSVTTPTSAHRPTLLLRMNTVPLRCSNNRRRANSQAWGRPASLASPPPSPVFPPDTDPRSGCRADAALVARRRKMARVTRTLGENVPPGLVFQPDTTLSPAPSRTSVDSSYSELDSPSDDEDDDKPKLSLDASEIRFARVSLGPLDSVVELANTAPTPPSSPTHSAPPSRPSLSLSADRGATATAWFPYSIRRSVSQRRTLQQPAVMRTEPGWTGEWNQEEDAVVKRLRELK
ncbi:hypothetical protein C8R47DRAFT_971994 [Mycena vitilis]|nr:hypothetical protein C8R47DRAFT_971994 [Mycena vitilis]